LALARADSAAIFLGPEISPMKPIMTAAQIANMRLGDNQHKKEGVQIAHPFPSKMPLSNLAQ
jgi:hypothetical protein